VSTTPQAPRVSVALCTHNGAKFVCAQVESILRQSVPVSEIVLSDDASTDDTVAIAERTVAEWPSPRPELVTIRNPKALGVVANFDQATSRCSGELIALCDQDDLWHREKIALSIEALGRLDGVSLVHTDAQLIAEDGHVLPSTLLGSLETTPREKRQLQGSSSFAALIKRNLVTGATTVFRSSLLAHASPFPPEWIHDEWLAILASAVDSTYLIDERLLDYRQHGGNQIGARKPTLADKLRKIGEPRQDRNRHLLARAEILVARIDALGALVRPARRELAVGKLAHDRARLALPRTRILRILPIAGGVVGGHYRRYSRGLRDALRDLAQPPGPR